MGTVPGIAIEVSGDGQAGAKSLGRDKLPMAGEQGAAIDIAVADAGQHGIEKASVHAKFQIVKMAVIVVGQLTRDGKPVIIPLVHGEHRHIINVTYLLFGDLPAHPVDHLHVVAAGGKGGETDVAQPLGQHTPVE